MERRHRLSSLLLLVTGFVFGLKHALEADHLLAVTTLISKTRFFRIASGLAVLWGLGHTIVLLLVGGLVLAFKLVIPPSFSAVFELIVGFVLTILAAQVLVKLVNTETHLHAHEHSGVVHSHFHSHAENGEHMHKHKPLLLGMLHGLAGSAGLTVLVLASVKSFPLGMLYVLVFGAGSIIGMIAVSSLVSLPFLFLRKEPSLGKILNTAVGISGLTLGLFIAYKAFTLL